MTAQVEKKPPETDVHFIKKLPKEFKEVVEVIFKTKISSC